MARRRFRRGLPLTFVLMLDGCMIGGIGAAGKKAPVAIEAAFKARISAKLAGAAELAADHIATRLSFGPDSGVFGGYELELGSDGNDQSEHPVWRHSCMEVVTTRDAVELCAMRQLHALASLCDVGDVAGRSEASTKRAKDLLKALATATVLPSLGLKLQKFDGADVWFHRKSPNEGPDVVDGSPALQASALMAVVRCASALGEKSYFQEAESWFVGLKKIYPTNIWSTTHVSMHKSGIIWESLALVASHLPAGSSFRDDLLDWISDFEGFLHRAWDADPSAWSFATARALAIRWRSGALKKKRRSLVRKWAQDHVDRFLGRPSTSSGPSAITEGILARIGTTGCTCGPLQGLASLVEVLADAELVQVVMNLIEKDVDRYQLTNSSEAPWDKLVHGGFGVDGAFRRDDGQLGLEKRRSLRMDDSAQCLIALTQSLNALESFQGVVLDAAGADEDSGAVDAKAGSEEL